MTSDLFSDSASSGGGDGGDDRILSAVERMAWLRLIRAERVGPITFHRLLERFGTAEAVLDALPHMARKGGADLYRIPTKDAITRELDAIHADGAELIAACEPDYPPLLKTLEDAPPLLIIKGHRQLLTRNAIAIVGTRNASANGLSYARRLAHNLGQGGFGFDAPVVVSGLARGIDSAAHQGALEAGTIAVVAGGMDEIYPPENEELFHQIVNEGVVLTEMPMGTKPTGRLFPVRNRIISGIVAGVVVVEASLRSGSLITAHNALNQNREVFAVPGSPADPRAKGANTLIRDGAHLIEEATDVLRVLGSSTYLASGARVGYYITQPTIPARVDEEGLESMRPEILHLLSPTPTLVDEIIRNGHFPAHAVAVVLLELELAGHLERHLGNRVALINREDERSP